MKSERESERERERVHHGQSVPPALLHVADEEREQDIILPGMSVRDLPACGAIYGLIVLEDTVYKVWAWPLQVW